MKQLGLPILVMAVSTFVGYVVQQYFDGAFVPALLTILTAISLFLFGITLHKQNRKTNAVYRKVIVMVLAILLVCIQLNAISSSFVDTVHTYLQVNPIITSMLYIYFGYVFVD